MTQSEIYSKKTDELRPSRVLCILSLIGDDAAANAAMRTFRDVPVLAHTVSAIADVADIQASVILAWDDQLAAIHDAVPGAKVRSLGPRKPSRQLVETSAALRWSDGWRGALGGRTIFDRGFDADAILAALDAEGCDVALLVDPSAALISPATLETLIAHLSTLPEQPYAFAPGAVGSGAMLLRGTTVADLANHKRGPGTLTMYHPDRPEHDPMAKSFAIVVPPRVARSSSKLTIDSARQAKRLSLVQANGVESTLLALDSRRSIDDLPRDVTIELTTRRATTPAWSMQSNQHIGRPDLSLATAQSIVKQLAEADDIRITFAGVGDPLLHPDWREIVDAARSAGIRAIHIETDLLPEDSNAISHLAASEVDIVSFHLPAAHAVTYTRLMGVDRMRDVLENVKSFLLARNARNSGVPILVPTFMKTATNLGEMEAWYDQWIRAVGAAVISGPSDFSGRIEYVGVADMTAGRRRACRRLSSRMTILSDGTIASCEEDIIGEQRCGTSASVKRAWSDGLSMLRSLHDEHRWDESELCKSCRMWDRP